MPLLSENFELNEQEFVYLMSDGGDFHFSTTCIVTKYVNNSSE